MNAHKSLVFCMPSAINSQIKENPAAEKHDGKIKSFAFFALFYLLKYIIKKLFENYLKYIFAASYMSAGTSLRTVTAVSMSALTIFVPWSATMLP